MYFYREKKNKYLLSALKFPRKIPLWQRSLITWADIILDRRTSCLVFGKGFVTCAISTDDIFLPYVSLYSDAVGPNFILMNYNAYPDRAHLIDELL